MQCNTQNTKNVLSTSTKFLCSERHVITYRAKLKYLIKFGLKSFLATKRSNKVKSTEANYCNKFSVGIWGYTSFPNATIVTSKDTSFE